MSNYVAGHAAETRAADYLTKQGYKIVQINWKTKYCEIDIVAQMGDSVHFIEVKYRRGGAQGRGIDYITNQKLRQMRFAAEMWVGNHDWQGSYQLAALGVDGEHYEFIDLIE